MVTVYQNLGGKTPARSPVEGPMHKSVAQQAGEVFNFCCQRTYTAILLELL